MDTVGVPQDAGNGVFEREMIGFRCETSLLSNSVVERMVPGQLRTRRTHPESRRDIFDQMMVIIRKMISAWTIVPE